MSLSACNDLFFLVFNFSDHYLPDSVNALKDVVFFMDQVLLFSKASVRVVLNEMAGAAISASQRIFFGRNC